MIEPVQQQVFSLFPKLLMLLCKQTISSYIVEIHHHCVKKTRLLKDSMQRCNSIIQLTIIWWRLLCVRSCANNSLNPNVLLCSSQMSWSACDRIGVDLAVNCSVKSVVSESWGKKWVSYFITELWLGFGRWITQIQLGEQATKILQFGFQSQGTARQFSSGLKSNASVFQLPRSVLWKMQSSHPFGVESYTHGVLWA